MVDDNDFREDVWGGRANQRELLSVKKMVGRTEEGGGCRASAESRDTTYSKLQNPRKMGALQGSN